MKKQLVGTDKGYLAVMFLVVLVWFQTVLSLNLKTENQRKYLLLKTTSTCCSSRPITYTSLLIQQKMLSQLISRVNTITKSIGEDILDILVMPNAKYGNH